MTTKMVDLPSATLFARVQAHHRTFYDSPFLKRQRYLSFKRLARPPDAHLHEMYF